MSESNTQDPDQTRRRGGMRRARSAARIVQPPSAVEVSVHWVTQWP